MTIKWYHILTLSLAVLIGFFMGRKEPIIETVYNDVPVEVYIDSISYVHDTLIVPSEPIDTGAIIEDYFTKKSFDTTIVVNEVRLNLGGDIYQNNLRGLNIVTSNLRPTQVVKEIKWTLSAGATLGPSVFSPTLFAGYDRHELGVGYNLIGQQGLVFTYKYDFFEF